MANKPQAKDGTLRALVREVLAMAPGYGFTDEMLFRAVRELLPLNSTDDSAILVAAEWNLGMDYVSASTNEDTDDREWRITNHGLAKKAIK